MAEDVSGCVGLEQLQRRIVPLPSAIGAIAFRLLCSSAQQSLVQCRHLFSSVMGQLSQPLSQATQRMYTGLYP